MLIRSATPADATAIAELLGELGYPSTATDVVERLGLITAHRNAVVLVAESDGQVVGLATGHHFPSIHATPTTAWLTTLVVGSKSRARGIGSQLTGAIEDWARQAGAVRISLTSGKHRGEAHAFYEHLGYVHSGLRLTKQLG